MEVLPSRGYGGGLALLGTSAVRISSLSVQVSVSRLKHAEYLVRAEYLFDNPGPQTSVEIGIPVAWNWAEFRESGEPKPFVLEDIRRDVKLAVAGRSYSCEPRNVRRVAFGSILWEGFGFEGWCVAQVDMPSGSGIQAHLEVPGWFRDIQRFDAMRLSYVPFPGPKDSLGVGRLDISLVLGPAANQTVRVLSPPGGRVSGGVVSWSWSGVKHSSVPVVEVDVDWRRKGQQGGVFLRAGSDDSAGKIAAKEGIQEVDSPGGSRSWCRVADSMTSHLEVGLGMADDGTSQCSLYDFLLVTGRPESESTWRASGVLRRGRLESCAHPSDGFEFALGGEGPKQDAVVWPSERANERTQARRDILRLGGSLANEKRCVRLRMREGTPGRADWCISGLTPRVLCREPTGPQ